MNDSIAVIGAGMMGGAIIKSLKKSGCSNKIMAADIRTNRLKELEKMGILTTTNNLEAASVSDIIEFFGIARSDVSVVNTKK